MTQRRSARIATVAVLMLVLGALMGAAAPAQEAPEAAQADLINTDGLPIGVVTFVPVGDAVRVAVEIDPPSFAEDESATGPAPGFHGFHVHAVGQCTNELDMPDFARAGGHFNPGEDVHHDHAGDMPVLHVNDDGSARAYFLTDRFTVAELLADDGTAVIVHANPDNYANIPERYQSEDHDEPGPDDATLATGDAGDRDACGVVEERPEDDLDHPMIGGNVGPSLASTMLVGPDAQPMGGIVFSEFDTGVLVQVEAGGLTPGFHGFHVHAGARCTDQDGTPDFGQAAGHLGHEDADATPHGRAETHVGDMPVLLADDHGFASAGYMLDRFTIADLAGAAVIIHEAPDNYANIPDRYRSDEHDEPGADETTRTVGDAGGRAACGAIDGDVLRLADRTRVETAVAISRSGFPAEGSAGAAVLARADSFADGLAGTPLAARVDGPLLLSYPAELHEATAAELQRVLPRGATVHLLGGQGALSAEVEAAVAALGFTPNRIEGTTRIETALAIADELGDPATLLITTGYRFPDALAAGAAAAHVDGAVLLTVDDQRHSALDAYLDERSDAAEVFAVGGPAARPYDEAEPVTGSTRIQTAIEVADVFFHNPVFAGIARQGGAGDDSDPTFADALTGGAHVGRIGGPVLLSPTDSLHPDTDEYLRTTTVHVAYLYGGTNALAAQVLADARAAITRAE